MNQVLTQEELQQVQDLRKEALELVSTLGELSYQQILMDLDKTNLTEAIKELKQKERTLLEGIQSKYGDGVINLETGEIQPKS